MTTSVKFELVPIFNQSACIRQSKEINKFVIRFQCTKLYYSAIVFHPVHCYKYNLYCYRAWMTIDIVCWPWCFDVTMFADFNIHVTRSSLQNKINSWAPSYELLASVFNSHFVIAAIYTSNNKERWLFIRIYGCNRNTHGFIHKQQYHVFCMQARHAEKSKGAYFSHLLGVSIGNLPSNLLPLARHYLQERFVICHLYHFSWSVFSPWFSSVLNQFAWDQNNIFYHQVRNYFQNIMICYV